MAEGAGTSERDRRAGRGLAAFAAVKGYHVLAGYAVAVLLPRLLGSPEVFGRYSKVTAALAILDNVLVASTIQSVSKFVSEREDGSPSTFRRLFGVHTALGVLAAALLYASAPAIARFHHEARLVPLFHVVAIIPLAYAVYAAAVGYLNGQHRFIAQAKLDTTFYTLKWIGILGAAALFGGGALAPIAGLAAAAVLTAVVAFVAVGTGAPGGELRYRRWLAFVAPLWLYHALLACILELDVQVLAKAVSDLALRAGMPLHVANDLANANVAFYHAAQTFAFVPYQLLLAMTFVVFPMVSRATSSGNEEEARRTIRSAMRISLLALLSVAAPLAGAADGVMRLAYPEAYLAGAPALQILSIGLVAFSLFVIAGTILASAARPLLTAVIAMVGLAVAVTGNYVFVRHVGIGKHTLAAAALGTSLGMGVALLLAGGAVYLRFRTLLPASSLLRSVLAAAVALATARLVPHGTRPTALLALAAGFAVYVITLFIVREIGAADIRAVRQVFARRGRSADN